MAGENRPALSGWIDFDLTNNCLLQHEPPLPGWDRDFNDMTPMRSILPGGARKKLDVQVTVTPLPI